MPDSMFSYDDFRNTDLSRREYLALTGAIGGVSLAGCQGQSEDGSPSSGDTSTQEDNTTSEPTEGEPEIKKGGTLQTTLISSISNLDAAHWSLTVDVVVGRRVVDSLFEIDRNLEAAPLLATDAEINDDATVWTFPLREDASFHPPYERPMTAEDVVANFDRIADPETASFRNKYWIQDAVEWRAIDDHTFQIEFEDTHVGIDSTLSSYFGVGIQSPDAIEDMDSLKSHPVGTGPFKFEEWVTRDHITLSKYENYWRDERPHVDEVIFRPITEPTTKITEIQSGDIDIIRQTPVNQVQSLQDDQDLTVDIQEETDEFGMLNINPTEGAADGRAPDQPTTNLQIRQAIAHAVDVNGMISAIQNGNAVPSQTWFPETSYWHLDYSPFPFEADPERAQQLIDEAGYDAPEIQILSSAGDEELRSMGRFVEDNLRQAGFEPVLNEYDPGQWSGRLFGGQFDVAVDTWLGKVTPEVLRASFNFDSEDAPYFQYVTENADQIRETWDESLQIQDREERKEVFDEAQRLLVDDAARLVMFRPYNIRTYRNEVKGLDSHPRDTSYWLRDVWLDR